MSSLPQTLDLSRTPMPLSAGVSQMCSRKRSDAISYAPSSKATIYLGTQKRGWLHGSESFLSFNIKTTIAGTAIAARIDSSAYSFIESVAVKHAGVTLCELNNFHRTANAMRDLTSLPWQPMDNITLGVDSTDSTRGISVVNNGVYNFAFALPLPLVGSMSDLSTPIGYLSSELSIEITWAPARVAITSTACTANLAVDFTASEVYFNSKMSILTPEIDASLQSSGVQFMYAQQLVCQRRNIPISASINERIGFQYHSLKSVMFWLTPSSYVNGAVVAENLVRAVGHRVGHSLKEYSFAVDGVQFPNGRAQCLDADSNFNAAIVMSHTKQALNTMGEVAHTGNLSIATYKQNRQVLHADSLTERGQFICGIDLDRASINMGDTSFQGANTKGAVCEIQVDWKADLAAACELFIVGLTDVNYAFENGACTALY